MIIEKKPEFISLVNDPQEFESQLWRLESLEVYPRVRSWLNFFEEHFSDFILSYSDTVFATLALAKGYELFSDQTNYEKELSFEFYKKIFHLSPHFQLEDLDSAKYLLAMALIYGRFHGILIGSPRKQLASRNHRITKNHLQQIFESLFVKFENPRLLTERLDQLDLNCLELLMHIFQGKNPRSFSTLPIPLSKKESFFFTQSSIDGLELKDRQLEKLLVVSKFLAVKNDPYFLERFLRPNHFFNFRLSEFLNHLEFWKSAYRFMSRTNWNETYIEIDGFVDYFMYKRHNENTSYSLKGRTPASVERAIDQWHQYGHFGNLEDLLKSNWGKQRKDTVLYNGEVYEFAEITNGKRLFEESEKMNHCAFSYIGMCRDGFTSVWSVSLKKDKVLKPILTIELQGKLISQVVRKNNQKPSDQETELLKHWVEEKGYELNNVNPIGFE